MTRWSWPFTIGVALVYTFAFATFITRHTSLPYYDSYDYLMKTWTVGELFHHATFFQKLNPALYMSVVPADRPPFLPAVAGILLGPTSPPASVAMVWLFLRVGAILLAFHLLSREFKNTLFMPAAAMVIFSSPVFANFARLYMMDEPFAAFGLLSFALIVIDDRRHSALSASGAAAGAVLLFLVKPVAPAFLLPLILVRALRVVIPLFRSSVPKNIAVQRLIPWVIPYLVGLVVAIALLQLTAYGPAIRAQYQAGSSGLWHIDVTFSQVLRLLSFLLPPWIGTAFLLLIPCWRRFPNKPLLFYVGTACAWWILFSFCLTYTIEDRLIGQAFPLVVAGTFLFLCQRPTPAFFITLPAIFFFTFNMLSLNGRIFPHWERTSVKVIDTLSPASPYVTPVPEVGLLPFARGLLSIMPQNQPVHILGVMGGMLVEPLAVNLAIRDIDPHAFNRVVIDWMPGQPNEFVPADLCTRRWFITQTKVRSTGYTTTGLWTNLENFHLLLFDPQSPLHPYFHERLETPLHLPWGEDTLTLWELTEPPPPRAIAAALRWIAPKLANDPRAPIIQRQLDALAPATQQ